MKATLLLALVPVGLLSACAFEATHHHSDGDALVKTQIMPEPMASCISKKLSGAATPLDSGGFAIDSLGPRLSITRDELQTIVRGPEGVLIPSTVSEPVIQCALTLAPPGHRG